MVKITAGEFYKFCVEHNACAKDLDEIRGKTPAEWWNKTEHGTYMELLGDYGFWYPNPVLCEELDRQLAPIQAEFERQIASIQEEYEQQVEPLRAEFDQQVEPLRVECERQFAPIWAEFDRQVATLMRRVFPNPFREGG